MARKKELSREERISVEIKRLSEIFKEIDDRKKRTVEGLIEESAFMRITLEDLKKDINSNGVIDEMPQGQYSILRESPYVKTYNAMIQRYTTINDKLLALLPKDVEKVEDDGFEGFVMNR